MRKNDITALHEKSIEELKTQVEELSKELATARLEKAAGRLSDTSKVRQLADDVARVKTIMTEKQLEKGLEEALKADSTKDSKESKEPKKK